MTSSVAARRGILVVAVLLLVWGVVVLVTGGFVLRTPWRTISSRAAIRPFIASALLLLLYVTRWRQHAPHDLGALRRVPLPPVIAAASIIVATVIGLGWGARIGGGPDASGYVSLAALFARGEMTVPAPPWLVDAPWPDAARAAAGVGYGPSVQPGRLAPVYSPGLPILMALVQVVAGPAAVFVVVPLLAGVAVWSSYRLGTTLGGPWSGAMTAVLVVTSPAFLAMTVQTMSDVPAMACWTLALVAALRGHAGGAGFATGMAILIRPNLVLVAGIPATLLLFSSTGRVRRVGLFACAAAAAAGIIAALNDYYYGSPLRSGYGSLDNLYSISHVLPNLQRYARWFSVSQTAWPVLGILAPLVADARGSERVRVALVTLIFPAAVFAMYLPYLVFQPDEWHYLRFLLPGYPALMAGFSLVLVSLTRRLSWRWRETPAGILIVALAVYGRNYAAGHGVFAQQQADRRYARAVAYARTLPPDAVLVSLAHSGTLRFYTGRDVLRFDAIGGHDIDRAIAHVEARGHPVYLIGDPFEIDMFRERFGGTTRSRGSRTGDRGTLDGALAYTLTARNSRSP